MTKPMVGLMVVLVVLMLVVVVNSQLFEMSLQRGVFDKADGEG